MSGLTEAVLIPRNFEPADSGCVTSLLQTLFDEVQETRKGRHWRLAMEGRAASLTVVSTVDRLFDYEDALLDAGCMPEDMPEAFEIVFGCSGEHDRQLCESLSKKLEQEFNGVRARLS